MFCSFAIFPNDLVSISPSLGNFRFPLSVIDCNRTVIDCLESFQTNVGPIREELKRHLAARSQGIASSHQDDNLPGHSFLEVLPCDDGLHPQGGLLVCPWITDRKK